MTTNNQTNCTTACARSRQTRIQGLFLPLLLAMNRYVATGELSDQMASSIKRREGTRRRLRGVGEPFSVDFKTVTEKNGEDSLPSKMMDGGASNRSCAILFFGLPRAFDTLVMPSLQNNIFTPYNLQHCDFFVHYFDQKSEEAGRGNKGGEIHSDAVLTMKDAILEKYNSIYDQNDNGGDAATDQGRPPLVEFKADTPEQFVEQYADLVYKIRETKDPQGDTLYFPWRDKSYKPVSMDNIIKMWHSIQSAWELMEDASKNSGTKYDTVAVIRSDVVYVTPLDLTDTGVDPNTNQPNPPSATVTIPGFDKWPVSDRAIYGPYEAVKVWATHRFSLLDQHVQFMYERHRGFGLHHERFFEFTMFPEMKRIFLMKEQEKINSVGEAGTDEQAPQELIIRESPTMCFMRARADDSVYITDCYNYAHIGTGHSLPSIKENLYNQNALDALEKAIGRPCEQKAHQMYDPDIERNQLLQCRDPRNLPEAFEYAPKPMA